jgi:hypothetical protein
MAAVLNTSVFATTPIAGVNVGGNIGSAPSFDVLTSFRGSDFKTWVYVKASEALGSIDTVLVRSAGSASSDAGSAGYTLNAPGGVTAGQYCWAHKTSIG